MKLAAVFSILAPIILGIASISHEVIEVTMTEDNCSCLEVFEELSGLVESTYIGYHLEYAGDRHREYRNHQEIIKSRIVSNDNYYCESLLQDYLDFFGDKHLFIFHYPTYSSEEKDSFKLFTQSYGNSIIKKDNEGISNFEGYWTDGTSKIFLHQVEGEMKAIVLEEDHHKGKELIAELSDRGSFMEGKYYGYDHTPRYVRVYPYQKGKVLHFGGPVIWNKLDRPEEKIYDPLMPILKDLGDSTLLFTIPSFQVDGKRFTEFLINNKDRFFNAEKLIIDVRGNVGGNALYFSFLPLFVDKEYQSNPGLVLASEHNLKYFEKLAVNAPEVYGPLVKRISENHGEIVEGPNYSRRKIDPINSNIKKVAIIADSGSMSASEQMIIHAKGFSSKVISFGENTGGVIDYTSINSVKLECQNAGLWFGYPTGTQNSEVHISGWNKSGIPPDILIPNTENDWVGFVIDWLDKEIKK